MVAGSSKLSRRDFLALSAGVLLLGTAGCSILGEHETRTPSISSSATTSLPVTDLRRPGSGATGLLYWDKARACSGYTLFGVNGKSFLLDMKGNILNTWPIGTNPQLLESGNLLDGLRNPDNTYNAFQEMDWEGKVVWDYADNRQGYSPHHDFLRIFNRKLGEYTTLYIAWKSISNDEAIAAGCDPAGAPYDGATIDAIVEVDMAGKVVWEWWFFNHAVQDIDPGKANYAGPGKTAADHPGKLDLNLRGRPVTKDWLHCNSLDYNSELDQIVINAFQGEFYVTDHGGTFFAGDPQRSVAAAAGPAGDFLYRFGDPARYKQGDPPSILKDWTSSTTGNKQLGASHNIQWVKPSLPGQSHFLVFNNGGLLFEKTPQSYVFEIDPFIDAKEVNTGRYVNPPDAGYYTWNPDNAASTQKQPKLMSNQIVWIYASKSPTAFFSQIISSCQRMDNGNTLICAGTEGHIFEVTPDGTLVWDYINPIDSEHRLMCYVPDSSMGANAIFRAYRYRPDYPGLKSKK